jgi:glycosyltransferase involved in cell wall biosynthesis
MRDTLGAYGVTAPMHVIPTGLLPDAFQGGDGAAFRARHGIAPGRPMLLFVGRVAFEKNIGFLLRMLVRVRRAIPDVLLVVCGAGPAEASLKRLAGELDISDSTRFVGYLDRSTELADCYRAADLFVFASRTETQGLVLLESMACGTPVVALAVMGTRDVLREGEGARIAPDDHAGFAALVVRLMGDTAERAALSSRAVAYAATWSAPATAARLVNLYTELLARKPGGQPRPEGTRFQPVLPSP